LVALCLTLLESSSCYALQELRSTFTKPDAACFVVVETATEEEGLSLATLLPHLTWRQKVDHRDEKYNS